VCSIQKDGREHSRGDKHRARILVWDKKEETMKQSRLPSCGAAPIGG
jgi:hypothetical protein